MSFDPGSVTIDPGVHDVGIALWRGPELVAAELIRDGGQPIEQLAAATGRWANSSAAWNWIDILEIVVERPQIYAQNKLKGDPNDLIMVAIVAGHCAQAIVRYVPRATVHYLWPAQWKGQLPKKVSVERTIKLLTSEEHERVRLPTASLQHNVWDAAGIGLHWHKRKRGS